MDSKIANNLNRETKDAVYFYTPPFYHLDNFSAHAVKIWGKIFPTVEHAYQWKKFASKHPKIAKNIFESKNPSAAKHIADENKDKISPAWFRGQRVRVMEALLRAKTKQHADVRKKLGETGKRLIAENSLTDDFWGIGPKGDGENMVGKIWMKIRDELFI